MLEQNPEGAAKRPIFAARSTGLSIEETWRSLVRESEAPPREKNVIWQELLRRSILSH